MPAEDQTSASPPKFDFDAFPADTLFHDRRTGIDRRTLEPPPQPAVDAGPHPERRARKERRRRIDPTTFEKQYTDDELEFMTAMQRFKVQSGKAFPTHADVLRVAAALGYRKAVPAPAAVAPADLTPPTFDAAEETPTLAFSVAATADELHDLMNS